LQSLQSVKFKALDIDLNQSGLVAGQNVVTSQHFAVDYVDNVGRIVRFAE
jgi:hypothetical protein